MEISTLREKKNNWIRLAFTRFLTDRYKMSFQTASSKMRVTRIRKWELVGIRNCILAFCPDYEGNFEDFMTSIESKSKFYCFMEYEFGMSSKTAFVRFQQFNFSELELKGLNAAYDEFLAYQKEQA